MQRKRGKCPEGSPGKGIGKSAEEIRNNDSKINK